MIRLSSKLLPYVLLSTFAIGLGEEAARTSQNNPILKKALELYPKADADHDGILTETEARAAVKSGIIPEEKAKALMGARGKAGNGESGKAETGPAASFTNIPYGPHARNVMDVYLAAGEGPRPVVVFIHGGGFVGGDKSKWKSNPLLGDLIKKGVTCIAINYPFLKDEPIQNILHHAARAIQFIRFKSGEWRIDKSRVAATGSSAGAGTSLWLNFRDDLADPKANDPVLRESSRVCAAAVSAAQGTYNIPRWKDYLDLTGRPEADPNYKEIPQFYHFNSAQELTTEAGKKVLAECDMLAWISRGDGPVYCVTTVPDGDITSHGQLLHHPRHSDEVKKWCDPVGVPCQVEKKLDGMLPFLLKSFGMVP